MNTISKTFLLAVTALGAGCANYDFSRARLPDGSWDVKKLVADLQQSKDGELHDGLWIPLIHMNITTFKAAQAGMPKGYELAHINAWGPIFMVGNADKTAFDEHGARVEGGDGDWVLWGLAWFDRDQRIETTRGERLHSRHAALLLFGSDHVIYREQAEPTDAKEPKANDPAAPKTP